MTTRSSILLALLSLLALSACNLPLSPAYVPPQTPPTPNPEEELAVVTFRVEVPPDTPADEPVLLSVLDEVTGLVLNAHRYQMEAVDATHYVLGLPLPVGTVLKYRYSRQGNILAEEHLSNGRPVRYRMVQVLNPMEVQDVVSRWNDTPFNGESGRISGVLTDAQSGEAVAGALVTAGGAQTLSNSRGEYLLEGLPPGTHNLVVYALDGAYATFQQQARVAAGSNTPADIALQPNPRVDVTFVVHVPEDTPPAVPLRLAGNLLPLGNTFADLRGGVSTLAARMPVLSPLPDGTYGLILSLPVGVEIRYKYTLGDGFWNSERAANGTFRLRRLIVPPQPVTIEDTIETWHAGEAAPITFDITVPETTPPEDDISIQFYPFGWMEPLRMWSLGGRRWAYILYSPLDLVNTLGYRYCRADQCGHADDERTPGAYTTGQIVQTERDPLGVPDQIERWRWLENKLPAVSPSQAEVNSRAADFVRGVEWQTFYQPSITPHAERALADIAALHANTVVLTPGWTFTRQSPPVLEPVAGENPLWGEVMQWAQQARAHDLRLALRPVPRFPTAVAVWWSGAPRDFSFWVSWFDQYRAFALHHADLAARSGTQTLILGGTWMTPALPGGTLADGSPSNVPPDADQRYRQLLAEIRERFDWKIAWAWPYPAGGLELPAFLSEVDQLYILWSAPLSEDNPQAGREALRAEAQRRLEEDIRTIRERWQPAGEKDIVLALAYPSVDGSFTACLPDPFAECLPPEAIDYPAPELPLLDLEFTQQAAAYDAVLAAVNQTDWIGGVVSRGYYVPTVLHDKSTSIRGKPAAEIVRYWYDGFAP
ncbi:MAG: carboxypeptidase regulatory-like domain-containing protein [Anaerolineae bacterium]|nr:MAG: carboxypeptidase regulatory-like domain-containing protein [Anaerolineae bacterium]